MFISEIISDLKKFKDKYGDKRILIEQGFHFWVNPIELEAKEIHIAQDIDDGLCYQIYRGDYINLRFRT